jgi:hypothetical protein
MAIAIFWGSSYVIGIQYLLKKVYSQLPINLTSTNPSRRTVYRAKVVLKNDVVVSKYLKL